MTDTQPSDRDVNRAIRSWLHEDRHEDASRLAGAVLDQVEATPQRRATWWPARRTPSMNKFVTIGLGAAAVVVVAAFVGAQLFGSSSDVGSRGEESPTPEPSPSASRTTPSPNAAPPLTQSFTSTLHGYSISYPEVWTAQAATEPWTQSTFPLEFGQPHADWLSDPTLTHNLFLTIASQPIRDSAPEDWAAEQMASGEGCTANEPMTVGSATGLIGVDDCTVATITHAGRGYWIQLYTSDDDPAAVAAYDMAWFEEVLATVELHPEDAVDSGSSPSP